MSLKSKLILPKNDLKDWASSNKDNKNVNVSLIKEEAVAKIVTN